VLPVAAAIVALLTPAASAQAAPYAYVPSYDATAVFQFDIGGSGALAALSPPPSPRGAARRGSR
jgi:hypothetical protein